MQYYEVWVVKHVHMEELFEDNFFGRRFWNGQNQKNPSFLVHVQCSFLTSFFYPRQMSEYVCKK